MLYEQVAPLSLILQEDFNNGNIDKEEFVQGLRYETQGLLPPT